MSLEALSFERSADVLVMLVLGGAGRLYGGLVGSIIFMIARDQFSGIAPQYWYFWIGVLLITVVMLLPNGILGGCRDLRARWRREVSAPSGDIALSTRGLDKRFGSLVVARDIDISLPKGARYALIGPNGAGKTTLINLMTGMLPPDGGQIFLARTTSPRSSRSSACGAGLPAPSRSTRLFPRLNALEAVTLAVLRAPRAAPASSGAISATTRRRSTRPTTSCAKLRLGDGCYQPTRELPYGQQRLLEIALALATRPKVLLLDEPAAGVPQEESGEIFEAVANLSRRSHAAVHRARHARRVPLRHATSSCWSAARSSLEGSPAEISADPRVREVYLGTRKHG